MAGETILVVDDSASNAKFARIVLEGDGFVVSCVGTAELALVALEGATPDLILVDLGLPHMSGLELTARVRADRRFDATAIVAWSGYTDAGLERTARETGCDGYLPKPIATASFGASVAACLRRKRPPAKARTGP